MLFKILAMLAVASFAGGCGHTISKAETDAYAEQAAKVFQRMQDAHEQCVLRSVDARRTSTADKSALVETAFAACITEENVYRDRLARGISYGYAEMAITRWRATLKASIIQQI